MTSDSDLRTQIQTEIERQRGSRATDIDLQVAQGVVTLTGKLPDQVARWNLRDAVTGMAGVERLVDDTMIVPEPSVRTAEADAARPWFPAPGSGAD